MNIRSRDKMPLVIFIISVALAAAAPATAYVVDRTGSVSSSATKPVTPGPLLDDFRYASSLNVWSCTTSTFNANGTCAATYTSDPAIVYGGAGNSLQLTYNVTPPASYAGYATKLGSQSLAMPTAYTAVSFYVKGTSGGEFFKVELANNSVTSYWSAQSGTHYYRKSAAAYITDYLTGGVTTNWQKVTIPLAAFANLDSLSGMEQLAFIFENGQSAANGSALQGSFYIDNITFETSVVASVKVESCGDRLLVDSLGGNMGVTGGGSGGTGALSFAPLSDVNHSAANALKYDYNVSAVGSYIAAYMKLGGGNTDATVEKPNEGGWIAVPCDFSAYNRITFWARATSAVINPIGFKVELHDFSGVGNGEPFYKIAWNDTVNGLSDKWKKFSMPFTAFKDWDNVGLVPSRISEVVFTLEYWNVWVPSNASAIYIDDIQFEK